MGSGGLDAVFKTAIWVCTGSGGPDLQVRNSNLSQLSFHLFCVSYVCHSKFTCPPDQACFPTQILDDLSCSHSVTVLLKP